MSRSPSPHPPAQTTGNTPPPPAPFQQNQSEELISKYKNLLNMARKSLEANKETINEKDKAISNLKQQLQEAKKASNLQSNYNKASKNMQNEDSVLRQILCMAEDSNGRLWVLFEYTSTGDQQAPRNGNTSSGASGHSDSWVMFANEQELDEYLQRVCSTGPPVIKPARLLTADESVRIQQESKSRVDLITEEFRRFKVRVEIARKQKDAETAQQLNSLKLSQMMAPTAVTAQVPGTAPETCFQCMRYQEEIQKLQSKLAAATSSRTGTERGLVRSGSHDNGEKMLSNMHISKTPAGHGHGVGSVGTDSNLHGHSRGDSNGSNGAASGGAYRGSPRLGSRKNLIQGSSPSHGSDAIEEDLPLYSRSAHSSSDHLHSSSASSSVPKKKKNSAASNNNSTTAYAPVDAMQESKNAYARQMLMQYLSCKDIVVKGFIEDALCKLFRFTDEELKTIMERRQLDMTAMGGGSKSKGSSGDSGGINSWSNMLGL